MDIDTRTRLVVNEVFTQLIGMNPAFKQAWPTETEFNETKRQWMFAFVEAGITSIEQLKKGLSKLRLDPSPFIPSPGKFIELCRMGPEDIGAPSVEEAFNEATRNAYPDGNHKEWSHIAVRHAYHACDPFYLRTTSSFKASRRFEKEYLNAVMLFSQGRLLDQISNQKTHQNYQELVGRVKADIKMGLLPEGTIIPSFEEWSA